MSPRLLHALLTELSTIPPGYLYPAAALRSAVRWAVVPQPTYAEIDTAITHLEQLRHITTIHNPLCGTRHSITDSGRAALATL